MKIVWAIISGIITGTFAAVIGDRLNVPFPGNFGVGLFFGVLIWLLVDIARAIKELVDTVKDITR